MDLNSAGTVGIKKKIKSQINVLAEIGCFAVDYIWREKDRLCSNNDNYVECCNSANQINSILLNSDLHEYDMAYIRFNRFSVKFVRLLKLLHHNKVKVVVEVPTYPFNQEDNLELSSNIKNRNYIIAAKVFIKIISNKFWPIFSRKNIDRVATYSDDRKIWGVPTLNISNGIEIRELSGKVKKIDGDPIKLICVSSCLKWHGYDRVLEGLRNYYSINPKQKVLFYIVGEGPETANYKLYTEQNKLQDYVVLTGIQFGENLDKLYATADIAFDALGRHRVGVYYNSSLKGKEYAERGLPIVSGVETEFDRYKEYKYYYRVPADDSPIDIEKVLNFYNGIKGDDYFGTIRNYAVKHFSYSAAMKKVLDFFET